jgi:hypothetical protein
MTNKNARSTHRRRTDMHELELVRTRRTAAARHHHHAHVKQYRCHHHLHRTILPASPTYGSRPAESDGAAARSSTPHRAGRTGGDRPKAACGRGRRDDVTGDRRHSIVSPVAGPADPSAGMPGRRASGRASSSSSTGWLRARLSPSPLDALAQLAARKA